MENKTGWFIHVEWAVMLITLLGGFYMIQGNISSLECRMDARMISQEQRTDRLYEMFITIVKESKK